MNIQKHYSVLLAENEQYQERIEDLERENKALKIRIDELKNEVVAAMVRANLT